MLQPKKKIESAFDKGRESNYNKSKEILQKGQILHQKY